MGNENIPISLVQGVMFPNHIHYVREVNKMTSREAIKILMLSPFYFKIDLTNRKLLVKNFCTDKKTAPK